MRLLREEIAAIAAEITEAADFLLSSSCFQAHSAPGDGLIDAHQTRPSLQPQSADIAWIKPR